MDCENIQKEWEEKSGGYRVIKRRGLQEISGHSRTAWEVTEQLPIWEKVEEAGMMR